MKTELEENPRNDFEKLASNIIQEVRVAIGDNLQAEVALNSLVKLFEHEIAKQHEEFLKMRDEI